MPRVRPEDRQFAERLGGVLRELRAATDLTQEEAAEKLHIPVAKLGRWERGDYAPKGYDLGRLFRFYEERAGAKPEWFFEPPEIVVINPLRDSLAGLAPAAESAADSAEDRAAARRRRAVDRRAVAPDRRPKRKPPGSPR